MKLIMPMAGLGSRFGEGAVKPAIDVNGVPMFVHAEQCIGLDFDERIFITRVEHNLKPLVKEYYPDAHIIELDALTEGTACTIMMAREHFEDGSSFMVSNCDQHIEWNGNTDWMQYDGAIACFDCPERDPKWSYALTDEQGFVTQVAEKDPISELATAGWYYWRDGRQYIESTERMIQADDRVNGEFYTCPTYNYLIEMGCQTVTYPVDHMQGIGTPEDLNEFLN
jgi:dTDP-glucose pyrophosphorylase